MSSGEQSRFSREKKKRAIERFFFFFFVASLALVLSLSLSLSPS